MVPKKQKIDGLAKLYTQRGHLTDELRYFKAEKRFGFEKAYEIDEAVWVRYSQKETL